VHIGSDGLPPIPDVRVLKEHTMSKRPVRAITVAAGLLLAVTTLTAAPSQAKDGDIRRTGGCTNSTADWKLKLGPRDGRIEMEFEVDSNKVGQTWDVVIRDNGVRVFKGQRTTQAPSGSFEVDKTIPNLAGEDRVVGVATLGDQTCRGVAIL
jgi:hypothetical protein